MSDIKISALPGASTLTGAETLPIVQGGVTKKVTTDRFAMLTDAQRAAGALGVLAVLPNGGLVLPDGVVNNIGIPGQQGFGVGIPGTLPGGFAAMAGSADVTSQNYGNYQFSDGSVMCYVPAFFYKWGTGSNGLAVNAVDIKPFSHFVEVASAEAAGYALHRAFYNAGTIRPGVFVDKYQCSNNGGVASSIKNGNPLSSAADHNPFNALTGAPANNYGGALAAAKTRGSQFFCNTRFIFAALALLARAHAAAATSTTHCAWYDATGVANFPKGCNNNALGDVNDAAIAYVSDGYSNCGKTGSANFFARTTHNGQASGVADLNGNMWEINTGLTSNGSEYYALKTSADVTTLTGGNTLSTDAWGATGIAANYDSLGATYESMQMRNTAVLYGSAAQVFSAASSGRAWTAAGAGVPLAGGTTGSNAFGNDGLWDYRPNELCVISGGNWVSGSDAGAWALHLYPVRGHSDGGVGLRAASYL